MPHRNTIRHFTEGGIYHVYNRGVEKRNIFLDEQDYAVFLHLLKYYLSPINLEDIHPLMEFQNFTIVRPRPLANIEKEVNLLAYCLMPNHFHLILQQISMSGVTKLIRRIATTYSMYFNKRYKRVGYLFQGRYKASLIESDYYLLHLSRYVHQNPLDLPGMTRSNLVSYPYSSYSYLLGNRHASWVKPDFILSFFNRKNMPPSLNKYPSYQEFVEKTEIDSRETLGNLALD